MVAAQAVATEFLSDKTLGILKHLGLGATEAINALLGVANDENRRRARRAGITGYPGLQSFPLQWVGVLKLIDQQMPHLRIESLANPGATARVGEQAQRRQLQIVHIQPGALTLQGCIVFQQAACEARHSLLVQPSPMLQLRLADMQQHVLRSLYGGQAVDLVSK